MSKSTQDIARRSHPDLPEIKQKLIGMTQIGASTLMMDYHLSYLTAEEILEQLEHQGFIGEKNEKGKRLVFRRKDL